MKKLLAVAASAAAFAGAVSIVPGAASAQPYYDNHYDHGYRHDNGHHRGWDRDRHWRYRGYHHRGRDYVHRTWTCQWRHGDRVCFYRYW